MVVMLREVPEGLQETLLEKAEPRPSAARAFFPVLFSWQHVCGSSTTHPCCPLPTAH